MKLKTVCGNVIALTLGLSSLAYASSYIPPERINCGLNDAGQLTCDGFDHQYLREDSSSGNLQKGREETFHFVSGAAYFTPSKDLATVFYTYKNVRFKVVKIKTVNTSIRPDLQNGSWKQVKDDLYTCTAGYMQCPITNLPEVMKF